jgi:hypothetical protein
VAIYSVPCAANSREQQGRDIGPTLEAGATCAYPVRRKRSLHSSANAGIEKHAHRQQSQEMKCARHGSGRLHLNWRLPMQGDQQVPEPTESKPRRPESSSPSGERALPPAESHLAGAQNGPQGFCFSAFRAISGQEIRCDCPGHWLSGFLCLTPRPSYGRFTYRILESGEAGAPTSGGRRRQLRHHPGGPRRPAGRSHR